VLALAMFIVLLPFTTLREMELGNLQWNRSKGSVTLFRCSVEVLFIYIYIELENVRLNTQIKWQMFYIIWIM
jgi:hypothetical protein